ncbi:hypothetical protein PCL_01484 [Purpureocillium lilacinum]|uniref:Uncharacterized protein n=1 Tax=Purpureocillium lilacinum TaxID=33203 RepID=A0A179GW45_PURLI|nr:hypothetical protein VFPBJ_04698 [Purpureocillium lilacinum]PWI69099.1 hypothetical protein PCL_01484 [Purpureocillium lilacinum]
MSPYTVHFCHFSRPGDVPRVFPYIEEDVTGHGWLFVLDVDDYQEQCYDDVSVERGFQRLEFKGDMESGHLEGFSVICSDVVKSHRSRGSNDSAAMIQDVWNRAVECGIVRAVTTKLLEYHPRRWI